MTANVTATVTDDLKTPEALGDTRTITPMSDQAGQVEHSKTALLALAIKLELEGEDPPMTCEKTMGKACQEAKTNIKNITDIPTPELMTKILDSTEDFAAAWDSI